MSRYRQTMAEAYKKVREQENKDHEVSMARGELEAIADKATQLAGALQGKSDEGNPLEAWVQSKITKAKDYINSVSDYLMYNPDMKQNEELEEAKIISDISGVSINKLKQEVMPFNVKVGRVGPGMDSDYEVEFTGSEPNLINYAKKHLDFDGNNFSQLKKHLAMEETEVNEKTYGWTLVSKAKDLAKKYANNYTKAVDEIEKLEKGLSKNPTVEKELMKYNEEFELDEASMKDIFTANQEGQKADEIAKKLGMSVADVKKILGEETLDEKVADSIIRDLQKAYADLKGKTISPQMATKMSKHLDQPSYDLDTLRQLVKAKIPFVSTLARNKIYKKTGKFEQLEEQESDGVEIAKIRAERDKEDKKEVASKEKENATLKDQIAMLKQKLENEKNKAIKPEPNPETGEVPLTIGIANKLLKDKAEKEAQKKDMKEDRRLYVESIAAVKKKAEKTGMPYSVLKQVYDRGMAAWKGGHRPGATQVQWALARVNSFVTKSSGTWGGADKDLAAKVKGSK